MQIQNEQSSPYLLQLWGTFLVLLSGTLYGFIGFLGIKILLDQLSVVDMLFWRFLIATIWMLLFSACNKRTIAQIIKKIFHPNSRDFAGSSESSIGFSRSHGQSREQVVGAGHRYWANALILCSIYYSCSSACYFLASQSTGTGPAMVIFFSFPVFVVLFAWIAHGERINKFALGSLTTIVVGLFLLKGSGASALNVHGILLAIASALFYAFYVMSSKKHISFLSPNLLSTLVCIGNTFIFLISAFATHTFHIPIHLTTWVYIIILGIFATALPIQFLFMGLKYVSSIKASILTVTEPVMTLFIGMLLLSESISSYQMIGVFIILLGAILIQFEQSN